MSNITAHNHVAIDGTFRSIWVGNFTSGNADGIVAASRERQVLTWAVLLAFIGVNQQINVAAFRVLLLATLLLTDKCAIFGPHHGSWLVAIQLTYVGSPWRAYVYSHVVIEGDRCWAFPVVLDA